MVRFDVNSQHLDPYNNFKFRVRLDGRIVAGFSKVGALTRTIELVDHREGGDRFMSRKSLGHNRFEAMILERGLTRDPDFVNWASMVWSSIAGLCAEAPMKDLRKDILIEVYSEVGQLALVYKVVRCWVSEYKAVPDFDTDANAVAIESIKFENEGWVRDFDVT